MEADDVPVGPLVGAQVQEMVRAPSVPKSPFVPPLPLHKVFDDETTKKKPHHHGKKHKKSKKPGHKQQQQPKQARQPPRQDVDLQGHGRCFLLQDVLTPLECARLLRVVEGIAAEEKRQGGGWEGLDQLFESEYRSGDRLLLMDEPLANKLWNRIKPGLKVDDVLRVRPIGFGNAGTWRPYRLNECIKMVRYKPHEHFAAHVDGPWVPRLDESSIYTVVIYLNDSFTGGNTIFRSESTGELLWQVRPQTGTALLFNHDTYHEGQPVLDGYKYILRTEMMFQRVDTGAMVGTDDYLAKSTYRKLIKVYTKSDDAADEGDHKRFVEKYLKAIQIQRNEQRSLEEDKVRLAEMELPWELYQLIFSYLSPVDIGRLQLVSKLWYDLAQDGKLWKQFYQAKWPATNNTIFSSEFELPQPNAEIEDWYGCWKARLSFERSTHPFVAAIDIGSRAIKCMVTTPRRGVYRKASTRSVLISVRPSRFSHYRGPKKYYFGDKAVERDPDRVQRLVAAGRPVATDLTKIYDMVQEMLRECGLNLSEQAVPFVFSIPPSWQVGDWESVERVMHASRRAVVLCAEDASVLVLARHGKKTGIVVDVGSEVFSISPVYEGKLLRQLVKLETQRSTESPPSAAALMFEMLRDLDRHKNGPELNRVDLDELRHNIVITGGGSASKGWDTRFQRELSCLSPDHGCCFFCGSEEERAFDAVWGACMMVESRSQTPLEHIFSKARYNTPSPLGAPCSLDSKPFFPLL